MVISIPMLVGVLLIHLLADFALQTHYQAINKGEGNSFFNFNLFKHVLNYTLIWSVYLLTLSVSIKFLLFASIYIFITHYVTDWITSRLSKPLFAEQDFHNGFVIVGVDQMIHYLTLIVLFMY